VEARRPHRLRPGTVRTPSTTFVIGLNDGSVSSFNLDLWAGVLLVVAGVIFGSFALERAGRSMPAKLILLVLAVPGALYLIFMLAILTLPGRWN
jgi:hypothetical protein